MWTRSSLLSCALDRHQKNLFHSANWPWSAAVAEIWFTRKSNLINSRFNWKPSCRCPALKSSERNIDLNCVWIEWKLRNESFFSALCGFPFFLVAQKRAFVVVWKYFPIQFALTDHHSQQIRATHYSSKIGRFFILKKKGWKWADFSPQSCYGQEVFFRNHNRFFVTFECAARGDEPSNREAPMNHT